ncbi:MAG TPA: hypothetical protein QF624_00960 [Dehalococcoidia bacterium]|nr:hypothetical protein [Dehalococcoidia bacterium]
MLVARGLDVTHETISEWEFRFAPLDRWLQRDQTEDSQAEPGMTSDSPAVLRREGELGSRAPERLTHSRPRVSRFPNEIDAALGYALIEHLLPRIGDHCRATPPSRHCRMAYHGDGTQQPNRIHV